MNMRPPRSSSSHIHSLGFDADTGTMTVRFHKGGSYTYHGVDQETFDEFHSHESPGSYFHANVKDKFKHRKA
jgi:hypothetical protein